jgi:hypothetical protein
MEGNMRVGNAAMQVNGVESLTGGTQAMLQKIVPSTPSKDWSAVLQQTLERVRGISQKPPSVAQYMQQMGDLLKIQTDISRYQLKVELVSKVSEGAVASVRKLQQNQ